MYCRLWLDTSYHIHNGSVPAFDDSYDFIFKWMKPFCFCFGLSVHGFSHSLFDKSPSRRCSHLRVGSEPVQAPVLRHRKQLPKSVRYQVQTAPLSSNAKRIDSPDAGITALLNFDIWVLLTKCNGISLVAAILPPSPGIKIPPGFL